MGKEKLHEVLSQGNNILSREFESKKKFEVKVDQLKWGRGMKQL
jgi:hypothetical protein